MKMWAVVAVATCLLAMLKPEIGHSAESTLSGTVLHANGSTIANAPGPSDK